MAERFYVKKEYLLAGLTIMLLFVSYKLAFKRTIEAWQVHQQLEARATSLPGSYQPDYMERKHRNIQNVLTQYSADTLTYRNYIVNKVAVIAEKEGVKLTAVPDQGTGHRMLKLNFEGDYHTLLKLLYEIEKTGGIGVVRYLNWEVKKARPGEILQKVQLEVGMQNN